VCSTSRVTRRSTGLDYSSPPLPSAPSQSDCSTFGPAPRSQPPGCRSSVEVPGEHRGQGSRARPSRQPWPQAVANVLQDRAAASVRLVQRTAARRASHPASGRRLDTTRQGRTPTGSPRSPAAFRTPCASARTTTALAGPRPVRHHRPLGSASACRRAAIGYQLQSCSRASTCCRMYRCAITTPMKAVAVVHLRLR